ncbi:MAG: 50S ribosomal protein L5 [Nanoarchaeota archaeon]
MNKMKELRIEKITLNIGAGKDAKKLDKGLKLLEQLSGMKPVKTFSKKRIPSWNLRPGVPIGCKVTIRKNTAEMLKRLLDAIEYTLEEQQFDAQGNISFGIHEYIDIPGLKYDPDIGIIGFQACVTFERPGFRIKRRRELKRTPGKKHLITKKDAVAYMQSAFKVKIGEDA